MESAQVFTCNYSGSIKNKLLKGGEKLFLKIEDNKISGKAFICNEEGRNGYIDNFEYPINDVREVFKGEYQGNQALIMNTRITSLYGTKKAQTIFPSIKDIELVIEKLGQLKENTSHAPAEVKQATTQSQPINRPELPKAPQATPVPEAPKPQVETKVVKQDEGKMNANSATQNVVIKQETPARPVSTEDTVGSALIQKSPSASVKTETVVEKPAAAPAPEKKNDSEDFQKRMEKLYVLKDCGMLTDKEFDAKKLELVSELCGMTDFNEKVQKLVVLKDCGMLSDAEFETRKIDIIKECCNTDVEDLDDYKRNIERIPYLRLGGMIDDAEFEEKKQNVLSEVEYSDADSNEVLLKKLQRWPILKETEMLSEDEYNIKVQSLVDHIDISAEDEIDVLVVKLNKWPILVDAGLISDSEFKRKQQSVIEEFVTYPWADVPKFKFVVERLMALKDCNWLNDSDFHAKKVELLRKVSNVEDYTTKVELYIALPGIGLISSEDYEVKKQEFVDDIFANHDSMEVFQANVQKLMILEKTGMLSTDEYTGYKMKLMAEL